MLSEYDYVVITASNCEAFAKKLAEHNSYIMLGTHTVTVLHDGQLLFSAVMMKPIRVQVAAVPSGQCNCEACTVSREMEGMDVVMGPATKE